MRRVLKNLLGCLMIFGTLFCAAFLYLLLRSPVFEKGESYTLYLGRSSSSLMEETSAPVLGKLVQNVAGESVQYEGDRLWELAERYRAKLLFTETACGIENYYFFSPLLGAPCKIGGYPVNLHIAVGNGRTAAGTPLIFGGF